MYVNKWGRYPCHDLHLDRIHPDDVSKFNENYNGYRVFLCFDEVDSFISIRDSNNYYRVKGEYFRILPMPRFVWGESVVIITKGKQCIAIIEDIMWHENKKEFFYFVTVNGKRKSKRYFEDELVITGNAQCQLLVSGYNVVKEKTI